MGNLFDKFDRLDTSLNRWLVANSIAILRVSLGLIFLAFGAMKFFPGLSPIEDLATQTTTALTFGLVPPAVGLVMIAVMECVIGLLFVTGRFLRVGVWLLGAQMLGAMSPLMLFPGELFTGPLYTPTLAAQYIVKDIVLVAAALVIAATWTGARIVAEPRSMRSTLPVKVAPRVYGATRSENRSASERVRRSEDYRNYAGARDRGDPPGE
ncbi:MAG: DoxX family protein [Rubrobacter sp.]|nr:DoxX family protein [Rubrobacter sp.]